MLGRRPRLSAEGAALAGTARPGNGGCGRLAARGGSGLGGGTGGGFLPGSPSGSENGGRQPSERVAQAPRSPSFPSPRAAHELSTAPSSRGFAASPSAQPVPGFERGRGRHAEATFPAPLVRVRAARRQSHVSARPWPRAPPPPRSRLYSLPFPGRPVLSARQ